MLTPAAVIAWKEAAVLLVQAGIYTVTQIKAIIKSRHTGATDEELNAIIEAVQDDARRRKAIADIDAAGGGQ